MDFLIGKTYPVPTDQTWNIIDSSKLKTFCECRRKFFYEYILGWRSDRPNVHTFFGESVHLALEYLLLNGFTTKTTNEAFDVFLNKYREQFPDESFDEINSPKNPNRFYEALVEYVGLHRDFHETFKVLSSEQSGQVAISSNFQLSYRIDVVLEKISNSTISLMDHKTGSMLTEAWRNQWLLSDQISTYFHAMKIKYGLEIVKEMLINGLFFKKVKDNSKVLKHEFEMLRIERTNIQMKNWLSSVNRICEELEEEMGLLATKPETSFFRNTGHCIKFNAKCIYHDFCSYSRNFLETSVPNGFKVEFWNPLKEVLND
jgi:hypothetical protein